MIISDPIIIAECFLQSFDAGLNLSERINFSLIPFLKKAIFESKNQPKHRYDDLVSTLRIIGQKNNMHQDIENIISGVKNTPKVSKIDYNVIGYNVFKNRIELAGIDNVYDAVTSHHSILNNKHKYISINNLLISNFKFIVREIRKKINL
jgi:hypothetical protein